MHQGAPWCAVALNKNVAGGVGISHQTVYHQVHAQPRRDAIGRGVAHKGGAKAVVGQLANVPLGAHLRFSVGSDGVESGILFEHVVTAGDAVQAARRGVDEPRHTRLLGLLGQMDGSQMIDVISALRVNVAQGIVGQRRQVDDGIKALKVRDPDVAKIHAQRAHGRLIVTEITAFEQVAIHADHLVAGSPQ